MPRNALIQQLRSRWKDEWNPSGFIGPVAAVPIKVDDAVAAFSDKREALTKSGHLTSAGVQDALKREAQSSILPLLKESRGKLVAARSAAAEARRRLTTVEIDKNDIVGFLQRQEIRQHLKALPDTDRVGLLLQTEDPRIFSAVQELPFTVPFPREVVERAEAARLSKLHGPEIQMIQDTEEAFLIVEHITQAGFGAVQQELGFRDAKTFEAFVEGAV